MNQVIRWAAIFLATCGVVLKLSGQVLGFSFPLNWIRVHTSDGPILPAVISGCEFGLLADFWIGIRVGCPQMSPIASRTESPMAHFESQSRAFNLANRSGPGYKIASPFNVVYPNV